MDWMAWTLPTAIFIVIASMLAGMTVWRSSPTVPRRGFLPMTTTRGDRLFIGLLAAPTSIWAGIDFTEWGASWTAVAGTLVVAILYLIAVMRWG